MAILYPPIVDSTAPAIVATESSKCRIYFSLSRFNDFYDIATAHVSIYYQDSGLNAVNKIDSDEKYRTSGIIINMPIYQVSSERNKYYIEITNNDLVNGWQMGKIYKVQIRLCNIYFTPGNQTQIQWLNDITNQNYNFVSEWSTVCIVKAIGTGGIRIPNYNYNSTENYTTATIDSLDFIGSYFNEDSSEILYNYQIKLYNSSMILLEESDLIYASQSININQIKYVFKIEPTNNSNYIININYTTISNYTNSVSITCLLKWNVDYDTDIRLLTIENDKYDYMKNLTSIFMEEEEGRIGLKLFSDYEYENDEIMIRRADSRDNFSTWTDIKNINIDGYINEMPIIYDYTIESGVWYIYGIQSYTGATTIAAAKRGVLHTIDTPIMRNFNYTFLLGENNQQLKLQFNNTLNNYKINFNEGKTTTIGGQFPFIIRNGITNYKTFSLNGLISFKMDENGLFFTKEQAYRFEEVIELYKQYNNQHEITHYDYIFEKEFRNAVIDFLHNGKVKLLKSPTEGNILIRLTDIGLTPQQSLSRIIYDFSSVANEIADNTMENYKKYNLYTL